MLPTYCHGEKCRGRGCLEGRGEGSEQAVEEGGLQEQEYDSQINTATFKIKKGGFYLQKNLHFISVHVSLYVHQISFDVNVCVVRGW